MADQLQLYADPRAFLAAAGSYLAAHPAECTVVSAMVHRLLAGETLPGSNGQPPPWFATATATDDHATPGGRTEVTGVAMRAGSTAAYVHGMSAETAAELARLVLARGETPSGANGSPEPALAFAAAIGPRAETRRTEQLFVLGELQPPDRVPGRPRDADASEIPLLAGWFGAFLAEVDPALTSGAHGPGDDGDANTRSVAAGVDRGMCWVWEGPARAPASLAMARPPAFGVARIGPVYTPPEHRGHGYAAALTAHAAQALRARGAAGVCLFADQANPTSNGVYRRIGFRPVAETVQVRVLDA